MRRGGVLRRVECWLIAVLLLLAGGRAGAATLEAGPSPTLEDDPPTFSLPPLYPRSAYTWPFATGPHYGHAPEGRGAGLLRTWVGSFDLVGDGFARLPHALRYEGARALPGSGYWIVQMRPDGGDAEAPARVREEIEAAGGRVMGSLPEAAFVVRLSGVAAECPLNRCDTERGSGRAVGG